MVANKKSTDQTEVQTQSQEEKKPSLEIKQGENSSVTLPKFEHSGMADGEITTIRYRDITRLTETTIPGAKDIQRPLVIKNLESLYQAEDNEVPELVVTASSAGAILISGYHRLKRIEARSLFAFHVAKGSWPVDPILQEPVLNYDTVSRFMRDENDKPRAYTNEEQDMLDDLPIRVRFVNVKDVNDLKRRIMRANNSHGQQLSESQKSKFAYLETVMAEEEGRILSLRDAAKMYGISHVAIISYRDSKLGKAEIAERLSEKSGQEIKPEQIVKGKVDPTKTTATNAVAVASQLTREQSDAAKKSEDMRVAKAFAKALRDLDKGIQGDEIAETVNFLRSYFTSEDLSALKNLNTLIPHLVKRIETDNAAMAVKQANAKQAKNGK